MLSLHAIDRALQAKDYDRLLRDLGRNGLVMPLPLRVQLAETPAGARGLGLRRVIELTYGPTALTREVIRALLRSQRDDGAVADGAGRPCCLQTATLLAGLGRALRDHGERLGDEHVEIQAAYDRALAALGALQRGDALFATAQDRTMRDRLLTSAFIAYLLLDAPGFASACQGHALLSVLEDNLDRCDAHTEQLINMARLARLVTPGGVAQASHEQALAVHAEAGLADADQAGSDQADSDRGGSSHGRAGQGELPLIRTKPMTDREASRHAGPGKRAATLNEG